MFALVWWCYPIVMACVAVPMAFFWLIENHRDAREEREAGPFPCLAYMGRDVHMGELWCWLLYGHDGDHADQSELPDTEFTRECQGAPEDEHRALLDDGEDLEYVSPGVYKITPAPEECTCGADHASPDFSFDQMAETTPLPPLPQRLSKVPAQTEHNDSGIPLCPVDDCGRWKGHGGTHW